MQAFSNCTFLQILLFTRHFNKKRHLSFVPVHVHLSTFQMVTWEGPAKVIFVWWIWGIHSIAGVFFRLYYAVCWVNVMEMHLVTLNPFLQLKLKDRGFLIINHFDDRVKKGGKKNPKL